MAIEKAYWYDHKPFDDNKGFIYGINYINCAYNDDDNENETGDIVQCEWFKTRIERNRRYKKALQQQKEET
jgi:hypothetical protein